MVPLQVMQERSGLTCAVCNGAVYDFSHVYQKLADTNSTYRPIIDGWVKKCGRRHVRALRREGAHIPERLTAAFSRCLPCRGPAQALLLTRCCQVLHSHVVLPSLRTRIAREQQCRRR